MSKCVACRLGRNWECQSQGNCSEFSPTVLSEEPEANELVDVVSGEYSPGKASKVVTTYKDDSVLRDQQSTGRKRAAEMYPLYETEYCEWRAKKLCGGGEHPITGCLDGLQQARHHGPDKNTLNNDEGNVHRICHNCHNRWHTLNDPDYVWGAVYNSHSPVAATPVELIEGQMFWAGRATVKAKD
jgi:hypothetical protein